MANVPSPKLDCTCQVLFSLLGEMEYSVRDVGKSEALTSAFRNAVANILHGEHLEWATEPTIPLETFERVAADICAALVSLNSSPASALDDFEFGCLCQNEAGRIVGAHFSE